MLNLSIFQKKIEQKSLECDLMVLKDEIKKDPLNSEKIKQLENVQRQLNKMIASRRFKLTAKKYYCTFYRSDIDPPDTGLRRKTNQEKTRKNKS
jgi:hypothetical protein